MLAGAMICWSYLDAKVFAKASTLPWSLLQGSIKSNLKDLLLGECPAEPVSANIYHLLIAGYNAELIMKAVKLLGLAPWSTAVTERLHASNTLVRKYHPELSGPQLRCRGFIHSVRCLLPVSLPDSQQVSRIHKKLDRLYRARPSSISGRHIFLRDVMAKAKHLEETRRAGRKYDKKKAMRLHAGYWSGLSPAEQAHYHRRAEQERSAVESRRQQAVDQYMTDLALLRQRRQAEESSEKPQGLSSCRIDSGFLDEVAKIMNSSALRPASVKRLRESSLKCPVPCEVARFDALRSQGASLMASWADVDETPVWVKDVARSRERFQRSLFACLLGEELAWFRFLFGVKKPPQVHLLRISPVELAKNCSVSVKSEWASRCHDMNRRSWDFSPSSLVDGSVLADCPLEAVTWVQQSNFVGGRCLDSDCPSEGLELVLTALATQVRARSHQKSQAAVAKQATQTQDQSIPFWVEHALGNSFVSGSQSASVSSDNPRASSSTDQPVDSDDEFQAMFKELEQTRAAWAEEADDSGDQFVISFVGESRLYATARPEAVHGVKCSVRRGGLLEDFCRQFGLHMSARFETSLYGMDNATVLAKFWQHRLQFLFRLWDSSAEPHKSFTQMALNAYVIPADAALLLDSLQGRALQRAAAVRDMQPTF